MPLDSLEVSCSPLFRRAAELLERSDGWYRGEDPTDLYWDVDPRAPLCAMRALCRAVRDAGLPEADHRRAVSAAATELARRLRLPGRRPILAVANWNDTRSHKAIVVLSLRLAANAG